MSKSVDPNSATVVLAKRVRAGKEAEFESWQSGINEAARAYPGFEGVEVVRPVPGVQDEYVVVFRFDSGDSLRAWLESNERAAWIARGGSLLDAAPVRHTIATPKSKTVTVVVTHRVKEGAEAQYRSWQSDIAAAVGEFEGFESTEVFEPREGNADWVVVFRFDEAKNLQRWLESDERCRCLERATPFLDSWDLHRISGGLGGWFEVSRDEQVVRTAPSWKQALIVLLALYPTVVGSGYLLHPLLLDVPSSVRILVGNITGVAVLTWLLMPITTRLMRSWLDPRASTRTSALGVVSIVSAIAAMALAFCALEGAIH
ncbi:MAG: hypothetical protein GXP55_25610 [Deltaproteobacteria bacterium]|nr:hypothetical protein [Deltaproteobacteria bacterium]